MKRIMADIVAFGKQYMRSGVAMFFAFAFPILLILIFGAIFSAGGDITIGLPVQDLDNGFWSQTYVEALNSTGVVEIDEIPADEDIRDYMDNESLSIAVLIPHDFTERINEVLAGNSTGLVNITLIGDPTTQTWTTVQQLVTLTLTNMNFRIANTTQIVYFETALPPGGEDMTFMDFFLPGVVGLVVMTNTLYTISSTCAEYRSRGFFKLLATTRIGKQEWLISKFIFYTLLLFASLMLTFAIGQAVFDMTSTLTPMAFAFIAAGSFLFLSMGMAIGAFVKDPESASAVANGIGFPMMFLSGIFFDLQFMPGYMQAISKVFPLTYFNDGLRATMIGGPLETVLLNLGIVIVIGLVFFVLASKLMSWKER